MKRKYTRRTDTLELIYDQDGVVTELEKIGVMWHAKKWAHGDQPVGRGCDRTKAGALWNAYVSHEDWLAKAYRSIALGA
jgi:hypothetical protein